MKTTALRISGICLLTYLVLVSVSLAQPPDKRIPNQDPSTKPINVKSEMRDAHKRWLSQDVGPIITEAERKAFLALTTDEERENFIGWFWDKRDPNPDTEENEYREEYYERIAYANEHFASGIPGWKTDRGRIYIRWGKPDSVEARPSGGSYDRPSYEGGGSTTVYPFETWFYRHLDGVGDGIEVEFVDPSGTGEYRIARNADEKDVLAMVPGAGLKTTELLGIDPKTNRLTNTNPSYQREQDGFFRRQDILRGLETPPGAKGTPDWLVSSGVTALNENPLTVDSRIDFFRLSDDKVMVAFTVQTDNRDLEFKNLGGLETARLNIFGRITAVSGKRTGIFEDSVTTNTTRNELAEMKDRRSIYQKMIALAPGTYKIDLAIRDIGTGNQGVVRQGFTVPKYDDVKLSTSSLMLASKMRATDTADTGRMFVIGSTKVVPNLAGNYQRGQEVGVYLQIYNAGIDQTTLRPAVDVEYVLTQAGREMLRQKEDWSGLSDSGQRLTLARLLPTEALSPGDYEVRVLTKDRVSGQVVEKASKFSVTK
ncbi:MAG: GWxTD domain-containing protein [Acidobacteria bacterium]|nr:GWxTD domain-containing protein [Acidobacteriota bacterium]